MSDQKITIAFAVSRGLVCRNILRTGVLEELLKDQRVNVVLFFPQREGGVPDYLRQEFDHPRIRIEEVAEISESRWAKRLWKPVADNLVYTESTDLLAREGSAKVKPVPAWWYPIHKRLFGFLSKFDALKRAARYLDVRLFPIRDYDELFKRIKPDVVYAGSIISNYDICIIKAAKRHGAKVVAMQKGWDNLQRQLIRIMPDALLVQNKEMALAAKSVQRFTDQTVKLTGFPQFDIYVNQVGLSSRDDFMRGFGLDPESRLIFFGSEGTWTPQDDLVIDQLLEMRERGDFPFKVSFVLRPHFSDVQKERYKRFKGRPGVFVDDEYRWSTFFYDNWDPAKEDMIKLASELKYASAVVCYASTLSLDAACLDKPIINVAFGSFIRPDGTDSTSNLYKMEHYQPVMASDAVEIVKNAEELKRAIIHSVDKPDYRTEGRERLRETMCGPLDGKSYIRIAQACSELVK